MKIQLKNDTAINFLRNLHPDFCSKIIKLWIDSRVLNKHERKKYANEMVQIRLKFNTFAEFHDTNLK